MTVNQDQEKKITLALIDYYLGWLSRLFASGRWPSAFTGRGFDYQGLVPYRDDPDLLRIDWRAYLNTGRLEVRIFLEEHVANVVVLTNLCPSMAYGTAETKRERGALLAASLAFSAVRFKDSFCFTGYTDKVELGFPEPRSNKEYPFQLAEAILSFDWRGKERGGLTRAVQQLPNQRALVFIISDFYGDMRRVEEILEPVVDYHEIVPIVLWDRTEKVLPPLTESLPRGLRWLVRFLPTPLRDLETGELKYVFFTRKTYEAHQARIKEQERDIREGFGRLGIVPYFFTEVTKSDLEELISLFVARRVRL